MPVIYNNYIDMYFSFSVGLMLAIAAMGFWQVIRFARRAKRQAAQAVKESLPAAPDREQAARRAKDRGDIPTAWVIATYLMTTMCYILLSGWLIDWHPGVMVVLVFFGFLYTPLINYVTTRLEGMAGQVVDIPMVREAAFILSGYTGGVKVWFLPVPMQSYSGMVVLYRQAELTGTKFWSIWKAELILVPIVVISSIFFANFIWSLAPIPSARYPFTEVMWEQQALNTAMIQSSTLGQFGDFERAIKPFFDEKAPFIGEKGTYFLAGAGVGTTLFLVMSVLNLPVMFIYGLLRGLNQPLPHNVVPQFLGALVGRFYFERRLGLKWRQYVPVVAAGFSCGMGLITVFCVGVNFLAKAVVQLPY